MNSPIETFFRDYERNCNSGSIGPLISQFADVFMVAGPQGAQAVQASAFALALPKRKQLFDDMGCQSTNLISLRETQLDGRYVMAQTQWSMTFESKQNTAEEILVSSTFIVHTGVEQLKIVLYLPHQDIMAILRNRGLGG
jgi:hypothetical protein